MTRQDVLEGFVEAAGMGMLIPERLARALTDGRFPTRGRSECGVVVLVDDAVFFVAEEEQGFVLYRLPMLGWWAELPGHVHTVAQVRVRSGRVGLCLFCGAQVGTWPRA